MCALCREFCLFSQCTHLATPDSPEPQELQSGQKNLGSGTQSALLMMGVKTPETC